MSKIFSFRDPADHSETFTAAQYKYPLCDELKTFIGNHRWKETGTIGGKMGLYCLRGAWSLVAENGEWFEVSSTGLHGISDINRWGKYYQVESEEK